MVILVLGIAIFGAYKYLGKNRLSENKQVSTNTTMNSDIKSDIEIVPIEHATMALKWGSKVIITDPVGSTTLFAAQPAPDIVLVTDIHQDHFNVETLKAVLKEKTVLIAPKAVADLIKEKLPGTLVVMKNGEVRDVAGISVEAIPMYNLPEKADAFHTKGRGNGYVLEAQGKRVYISGDTSGIPEMRALKNIDIAFVCMNLPYTMSIEEAAEAVLAFKPKEVIPYHYRGTSGLSDTKKFKALVNAGDPNINVNLLNFYPN